MTRPAGIVVIAVALLLGIGLIRDPLRVDLEKALVPPSASHPMGTDHLGRDLLARIAHGAIWDFVLGGAVVIVCLGLGTGIGLIAGYRGGRTDTAAIVVMDLFMSVPHTIVAMVVMVLLGYNAWSLVFALALTGWVKYARMVRSHALSLRERDFVLCEKLIGAGPLFILGKHLLPNVMAPVLGLAALDMGHTLMAIAALGFLGLGLQPPAPEWGTMIMESRPYLMIAPWNAVFPGLFVFGFIAAFTHVGHRVQEALTPSQEQMV